MRNRFTASDFGVAPPAPTAIVEGVSAAERATLEAELRGLLDAALAALEATGPPPDPRTVQAVQAVLGGKAAPQLYARIVLYAYSEGQAVTRNALQAELDHLRAVVAGMGR